MCGVFPKEGIGPTLKTDGVPCLQVNGEFPLSLVLLPLAGPANGDSTKERASSYKSRRVRAGNVSALFVVYVAKRGL